MRYQPAHRQAAPARTRFGRFAATAVAAILLAGSAVHAATIADFDFSTPSVTNSTTSTATASSVVAAPAGTSVSLMTLVGPDKGSGFSISGGTNTGYISAGLASNSQSGALTKGDYHTFTVTLTNAHELTNLSFDFGGSNNFMSTTVNVTYFVQAIIGAGPASTIGSATYAMAPGVSTSNIDLGGSFNVNLGPAFANLANTTVKFNIYGYNSSASSGHTDRFRNVVLTGAAVPTPAALPAGAALLGLLTIRRRRQTSGC